MIYIWPSLDFIIFTQSHMPFKIKTTRLFLNSTLVQRKTTQLLFELEFCKLLAINKVRKVEHKYFERPTICKTLTKKLENIGVKCLQNNKFLKNTKVGHGDLKTFWTKTYWLLQVFPENTRFSFFCLIKCVWVFAAFARARCFSANFCRTKWLNVFVT